ncbi:extracellular solute-binding protein [Paenibacillus sp. J5C_2022]|uniref:ABC transporter substrate-binding protein n=1 Tax=Paenibacillus sp. J5C2022 TaxID=2977129 RepID=UPI0021D39822|nr:extracellular solute-binding protein [Paenibacillus sp. J5C2022]MCU6707903.1 extracellular solute-binding protein [Paenibacillus sp. J5C2022]
MKKGLLVMLILMLSASMVLAGCSGNGGKKEDETNKGSEATDKPAETKKPDPTKEPDKVEPFTITLRHIQIGDAQKNRKAILDDVVKKTEEEVAGLKIELDGVEDQVNRYTKLPAEMTTGNPPQIFDLFGGKGDAQKYAEAGRLLELTPILEELGLGDKFHNLEQFMIGDKIYGLPIGGSTEGIYYNKKLFADLGIAEPKTLEELEAASDKLKENGITPFAMGSKAAWVPNMLINTLIGRYAGPDMVGRFNSGDLKFNDPTVVAAYDKYADWVKRGYFTKGDIGLSYDQMLNEFLNSKAGMMFDGSWRSSAFENEDLTKNITSADVGYINFPSVPNGVGDQTFINGNYSNGYGFSADLDENELKAVKAFIKNLYNEEMQVRGLHEDGVLPSMKVPASASDGVTNPVTKQVVDLNNNVGGQFSHFEIVITGPVYAETEVQLQAIIAGIADGKKATDSVQTVLEKEQ